MNRRNVITSLLAGVPAGLLDFNEDKGTIKCFPFRRIVRYDGTEMYVRESSITLVQPYQPLNGESTVILHIGNAPLHHSELRVFGTAEDFVGKVE